MEAHSVTEEMEELISPKLEKLLDKLTGGETQGEKSRKKDTDREEVQGEKEEKQRGEKGAQKRRRIRVERDARPDTRELLKLVISRVTKSGTESENVENKQGDTNSHSPQRRGILGLEDILLEDK